MKVTDARGPEQRALQQLTQAEAVFRDVMVQQQQGGGGGGGGQQSDAQDLADLFELRQERMRNQYE
jgi:molybdenum-dependent DNA-binding transcriptional regulator ModE